MAALEQPVSNTAHLNPEGKVGHGSGEGGWGASAFWGGASANMAVVVSCLFSSQRQARKGYMVGSIPSMVLSVFSDGMVSQDPPLSPTCEGNSRRSNTAASTVAHSDGGCFAPKEQLVN